MRIGRSYPFSIASVALAFFFGVFDRAAAHHPFHISTAEVEFNAQTKRLEVGLKCQSMDLERALGGLVGKKIDIEKDPQVDALVTRYLSHNFYLAISTPATKDKTASTEVAQEIPAPPKQPIKFIGKEFETTWVWIYFELQPPPGDDPLVLVNRVLFEVNTGQINTCLIRQVGKRHAIKSTTIKPLQEFKREWLISAGE
jgi:hypothetical protein